MTLRYCESCKEYTLSENCIRCSKPANIRKPGKFSQVKDYSSQRLKTRGLV